MTLQKVLRHLLLLAILYVGFNVFTVSVVTLIHPTKMVMVITDTATNNAVAGAILMDEQESSVLAKAGETGSILFETLVQDQGCWVFPRLGVTANLAGRKYTLVAEGYQPTTWVIPEYSGQEIHLHISLNPINDEEDKP